MNEDTRPHQERCGLTAAELADWHHISAEIGRQLAVTSARRARIRLALSWLPLALFAVLLYALLTGGTS